MPERIGRTILAKNNLRKRRTGRYFGTCSKAPSLSCHLTAVILPVQPLSRLSCRGLFRGLEQPFFHNCRGIPPPAVYPVVAGSGCLPIPTGPHSNFSLHLSAESGLNALSASIPLSSRHKVRAQKTWGSTFSNRQFSLGIPLLFSAVRSSSHLAQLQAHH